MCHCRVVPPPCGLHLHKHQQEGHHKLCSCLPEEVLAIPVTNSIRKQRSFSDVNSWRSYERCLFFNCFVFSVHVNMGVRMTVCMPVGLASTALPIFCQTSLYQMGLTFLSFLNVCIVDHFQIHCSQPSAQLLSVWEVRRLKLQSAPTESEHWRT